MSTAKLCPDEKMVSALLAGSLPRSETEALEAHLKACPACRETRARLAKAGRAEMSSVETLAPSLPAAPPLPVVQLGHYEVREMLGQGGMGKVYKAFDPNLHRVVAIKVMAESLAASGEARQRFMREARSAAVVTHENVVVIHEVNGSGEVPYLVMQFVSGQSLQERIDKGGALPLKDVVRIGMQAAAGLAAAHKQGLVHRDVKPANILLENGVERVKLTDFGLARAVDDASLTQSGVVAGTPAYMSPEQANGEHVDHRSDLFSLGSVLYAMATGHAPFRASNTMAVLMRVCQEEPRPLREANPEMPEWLEKVVAKLMAKDVKRRFQSADEVAELLGKALVKLQATEKPAKPRKRLVIADAEEVTVPDAVPATRPAKKRSALPVLLAGAVVLLVAGGLGLAWGLHKRADGKQKDFVQDEEVPRPPRKDNDKDKDALPVEPKKEQKAEWVPLFNGKDLTGWETANGGTGNWAVVEGALSCFGERDHLYSKRGDYGDFHLRTDVRINEKGNSGIYFRAGNPVQYIGDYEAQITTHPNQKFKTGALSPLVKERWPPPRAGEWFTYEVVARGDRMQLLVNGKETADHREIREGWRAKGHFALQHHDPGTKVEFRRIEIVELPRPGWTSLFNGKDKTGWKTHPDQQGGWEVEDGDLVGRSSEANHLYSDDDDYENFHLRAEAKANKNGNGGVYFRSTFGGRSPTGYEAQILHSYPKQNVALTGSLYRLANVTEPRYDADEWFTLEVIAVGNRLTIKVNGETTAEYTDQANTHRKGHLALQVMSDKVVNAPSVVRFRRIEVKRLQADK